MKSWNGVEHQVKINYKSMGKSMNFMAGLPASHLLIIRDDLAFDPRVCANLDLCGTTT